VQHVSVVCLDGELVPLAEARIPVTDEGLLRGDGVFEVLRLYGGVPYARELHLERLARSAANLRLELDAAACSRDIDTLLAAASPGDCLLRLLATRGGHRIALLEPLPAMPETMALGYVEFAPVRVLDGIKSLSYAANMLATRVARERGFDDALLVTPHGRVLELPTASFFWVSAGTVHTTPLAEHILDSITRRVVLEVADVRETAASRSELRSAEEAFIASSVVEVLPVSRVEEQVLAAPGPLTSEIAGRVRAHVAAELVG
jgi:branched-chain amino acid aminotransferase